jgi:hypothetical protein
MSGNYPLPAGLWHNPPSMFRSLALSLVLISVGISLPTRTG